MRPFGFLRRRNSGVRVAPWSMSSSIRSNGMPELREQQPNLVPVAGRGAVVQPQHAPFLTPPSRARNRRSLTVADGRAGHTRRSRTAAELAGPPIGSTNAQPHPPPPPPGAGPPSTPPSAPGSTTAAPAVRSTMLLAIRRGAARPVCSQIARQRGAAVVGGVGARELLDELAHRRLVEDARRSTAARVPRAAAPTTKRTATSSWLRIPVDGAVVGADRARSSRSRPRRSGRNPAGGMRVSLTTMSFLAMCHSWWPPAGRCSAWIDSQTRSPASAIQARLAVVVPAAARERCALRVLQLHLQERAPAVGVAGRELVAGAGWSRAP